MQDQPDFTAQHRVVKDDAENSDFFFFNASDDRTFLNQFLPLSMRWLIVGCLLKKAQASQKFVSTSKRPRSNQVLVKNVD